MPKLVCFLQLLLLSKVCCMDVDTLYRVVIPASEVLVRLQDDSELEREFTGKYLKNIESFPEEKRRLENFELGLLALVYKNWQICPGTGNSYNKEYLHHVFANVEELKRLSVSSCVYLVIDDNGDDIGKELVDIIKSCSGKGEVDVYLSRNDGNIGIRDARIKLFNFAKNFKLPYFCIFDSDDIPARLCSLVMYQAMINNPGAIVGLGEYSLIVFPDMKQGEAELYLKDQYTSDVLSDFEVSVYSKDAKISGSYCRMIDGTLMSHFVFDKDSMAFSSSKSGGYLPMIFKNKEDAKCNIRDTDMAYWCSEWMGERDSCLIILPKSNTKNSYLYGYRGRPGSHSHIPRNFNMYKNASDEVILLDFVFNALNDLNSMEDLNFTLLKLVDGICYIDLFKGYLSKFDSTKVPENISALIVDKKKFFDDFIVPVFGIVNSLKEKGMVPEVNQILEDLLAKKKANNEWFYELFQRINSFLANLAVYDTDSFYRE